MSRIYSTSLLTAPRDVRVASTPGGSLTRGNRNSTFLGRETTSGLLAPVANPANPAPTRAYARKASPEPRHGKICPGCAIEVPLLGRCNQCW